MCVLYAPCQCDYIFYNSESHPTLLLIYYVCLSLFLPFSPPVPVCHVYLLLALVSPHCIVYTHSVLHLFLNPGPREETKAFILSLGAISRLKSRINNCVSTLSLTQLPQRSLCRDPTALITWTHTVYCYVNNLESIIILHMRAQT